MREERGQTQDELGEKVASLLRLPKPYGQSHVSAWERGIRETSPAQLMAIEQALDVPPGMLTREMGWVPIGADATAQTVADAIARDVDLTPRQRVELTRTWEAAVAATRQARTNRRPTPGRPGR